MMWRIRDWRPKQLFTAWAAYWAGLAVTTLSSPALAAWRATHLPADRHGSISGGATFDHVGLTIKVDDVVTYASTVPHAVWASLVFGPPLLLALVWIVRVRRAEAPASLPRAAAERIVTPVKDQHAVPRR
jgi:hypothetical protein